MGFRRRTKVLVDPPQDVRPDHRQVRNGARILVVGDVECITLWARSLTLLATPRIASLSSPRKCPRRSGRCAGCLVRRPFGLSVTQVHTGVVDSAPSAPEGGELRTRC